MLRLLLGRVAQAVLVVGLVVSATFVLIRLAPGDPYAAVTEDPTLAPEVSAGLRRAFGFDDPIATQYVRFLTRALRGDLGWSSARQQTVGEALADTLPNTLLLMGTAVLLGLVGGVALGAWQGWKPHSTMARLSHQAGVVGLAVPEFVLALLLLLGPASLLGLFPVARMRSVVAPDGIGGLIDLLHHLVLPAFALAIGLVAVVARHQRAAMAGVRDREFIRAARAKGVPEREVLVRHALRNSLVPVLTLLGVILPSILGGAVLVESIFAWPGMGSLMIEAVNARDYHLVVGCAIVGSASVVAATLLSDLAVLWADPRLRSRR